MRKIKYGLFCYDTENIGDEIQSLAASRFLPKIDFYINRDNIDESISVNKNDKIKLIMNGWYIEPSSVDNKIHWPPKSLNLDPLLVSMHVSFLNGSLNTFKKKESLEFLHKYSPVGARDQATKDYLDSIGIPSYFSGCLTLTLLPDKNIKKADFILASDVDDDVYQAIQKNTDRPVIRINSIHTSHLSTEQKFKIAKYWLTLYQSAHLIVTTRLHAMLPGLALGTPVISLPAPDSERFTGLVDLTNHFKKNKFIKNAKTVLEHPPKNPDSYKEIRNILVKKCTEYTGYDTKKSYLDGTTRDKLYSDPVIIEVFASAIQSQCRDQREIISLNSQINEKNDIIEKLTKELALTTTPSIKVSIKNLLKAIKNKF